jgi:hypothetical protein
VLTIISVRNKKVLVSANGSTGARLISSWEAQGAETRRKILCMLVTVCISCIRMYVYPPRVRACTRHTHIHTYVAMTIYVSSCTEWTDLQLSRRPGDDEGELAVMQQPLTEHARTHARTHTHAHHFVRANKRKVATLPGSGKRQGNTMAGLLALQGSCMHMI